MASGFPSRRRQGGSRRTSRIEPISITSMPMASTSQRAMGKCKPRSNIAAALADQHSCTCAPRGSWVMPEPTSRSNGGQSRSWSPWKLVIRCCAARPSLSNPA
jgi:hypothetical protein